MLRKARQTVLLPILVFSIVLLVLFAVGSYFAIENIEVEGVQGLRGIEKYSGSLLVLLTEDEVTQDLLDVNPGLASVNVYKKYPDTLYISARASRPVIALSLADGTATLGDDGTVLTKSRTNNDSQLPFISYYQPLFFNQFTIGEMVDEDAIQAATHFANDLLDLGVTLESIDITNENMIVLLTDDFSVLITSEEDVTQQFQKFEYTYNELRKDARQFSSIDVRFDKPIIKLIE